MKIRKHDSAKLFVDFLGDGVSRSLSGSLLSYTMEGNSVDESDCVTASQGERERGSVPCEPSFVGGASVPAEHRRPCSYASCPAPFSAWNRRD